MALGLGGLKIRLCVQMIFEGGGGGPQEICSNHQMPILLIYIFKINVNISYENYKIPTGHRKMAFL